MAITVAAFQTACESCRSAIASHDWATAWTAYGEAEAINAGLVRGSSGEGFSIERRDSLMGLARAIAKAQAAVSRQGQTSRLIRTRTRHPQ